MGLAPWIDGSITSPEVHKVERCWKRGLYAPLLNGGILLVDGTAASCYAIPRNISDSSSFRRVMELAGSTGLHSACHSLFLPLRILWQGSQVGDAETSETCAKKQGTIHIKKQGTIRIHPYAWVL